MIVAHSNNHVFTAVMIQLLKFLASCPEWCRINLELGITSPKDSTKRDMTELGHLERHLGSLLDLRTGIALPRTPAVKRLVIQKQYHRQMSPHCLARLFNQSFVNTEFFSLQRRCRITETQTEVEYMRGTRTYELFLHQYIIN